MSVPYSSYTTKLQVSISSVFTDVAAVRQLSAPALAREVIDVTHLNSPSAYREKIASFRDGGEVSMQIIFDPGDTSIKYLHNALASSTPTTSPESFKIVWPDTATVTDWTFSGWVTGFQVTGELGDALTADCTITVSGVVALPT